MTRSCESFRVEVRPGFHINVYHWKPENPSGKGPLLFVHATGFHARVWNQVIEGITDREIYSIDSPGHGLSDRLEPPFTWQMFADLLRALIEKLGLSAITGVGHSMGGHLLTLIAAELPVFEKLVLLDPIILPAEVAKMSSRLEEMGIKEHPTAKRRNEWGSPEEMFQSFVKREPFCEWSEQVLRDYCEWGLLACGDHYELACPPRIESAIYLSSGGERVYEAIPRVTIPVAVIRGRPRRPEDSPLDFRPSPTDPDLEKYFPDATDRVLQEYSHFFPFEEPQLVIDILEEA